MTARGTFVHIGIVLLSLGIFQAASLSARAGDSSKGAADAHAAPLMLPDEIETPRMKKWRELHYGLFLHFGMNTMVGTEHVTTKQDPQRYAPKALDVDSWVHAAREGGMKYAVLTAKHDSGFCLWDSKAQFHGKQFDYDVAASGNKTDVVGAFVKACKKYDVAPGLYYCLADSVNNSTSVKGHKLDFRAGGLPEDYFELVQAQLDELATNYPECHYFWIDTPQAATAAQVNVLYDLLRRKNAENVVLFNWHLASPKNPAFNSNTIDIRADVVNTEVHPASGVVSPWRQFHDRKIFVGYEHCDELGKKWFNTRNPKSTDALFALYQRVRKSGGNLLLDIGPRPDGTIRKDCVDALVQLRKRIEPFEESLRKETSQ